MVGAVTLWHSHHSVDWPSFVINYLFFNNFNTVEDRMIPKIMSRVLFLVTHEKEHQWGKDCEAHIPGQTISIVVLVNLIFRTILWGGYYHHLPFLHMRKPTDEQGE